MKYTKFKNYSLLKMLVNFLFSFVLTILIFAIPVTNQDSWYDFFPKIWDKLAQGTLFGTIISINGTYMITLYGKTKSKLNIKDLKSSKFSFEVLNELVKFQCIPFFLSLLSLYLLTKLQNNTLHWSIIILEIVLYVISIFFYGYTEKLLSNEDLEEQQETFSIEHQAKSEEITRKVSDVEDAIRIKELRDRTTRS